jgi:hypothetical protein
MIDQHMMSAQNTRQKESSQSRHSQVAFTLKCWPEFFEAIKSGTKTHDLRRADDRKFQVGDLLRLQEFDPKTSRYSGRELTVKVTYITSGILPCALSREALHSDFCILSITKISEN